MMLGEKVEKALNGQVNAEFYSAFLYLSMSACFQSLDLPGFANWMHIQFQEEESHAMKLYGHILDRGGKVVLQAVNAPPVEWDGPLDVMQSVLEHERKVTVMINNMVYLARDERDNATEIFLQWFVNEQVEEEYSVGTIVGQLRLIKDSPQALFLMDKELSLRAFTPLA